jgi:TonB family protein
MLPHPLSRSAPGANDRPLPPLPDLALILEQHVTAGFPPDLALDLALNELVVRAADATHATAAALALQRRDQMVCRAATGLHAPDLGTPLDTRNGLSGACVRTRSAQLSSDTESDPRVDPAISRRLGIRSMLIVPVFDHEAKTANQKPPLTGVLEVFSPFTDTFTQQSQTLLLDFADECARICRVAANLKLRPPAEMIPLDEEPISSDTENTKLEARAASAEDSPAHSQPKTASLFTDSRDDDRINYEAGLNSDSELLLPPTTEEDLPPPVAHQRQPYEVWTLILGGLVILAAAFFSFMIGSRIGWLRSADPVSTISSPIAQSQAPAQPELSTSSPASSTAQSHTKDSPKTDRASSARTSSDLSSHPASSSAKKQAPSSSDELVVYDKDKVVFRMKPVPAEKPASTQAADTKPAQPPSTKSPPRTVWLAPAQAESRLLSRIEPEYPADALADHRSGNVTLEVHVAEDGTVSGVRTLNGDPLLAAAAAQAVRNWRYEPYRAKDQPSKFQTDVTLTFSLPN